MSPMFPSRILLPDDSGEPLRHPQLGELFDELENGGYRFRGLSAN